MKSEMWRSWPWRRSINSCSIPAPWSTPPICVFRIPSLPRERLSGPQIRVHPGKGHCLPEAQDLLFQEMGHEFNFSCYYLLTVQPWGNLKPQPLHLITGHHNIYEKSWWWILYWLPNAKTCCLPHHLGSIPWSIVTKLYLSGWSRYCLNTTFLKINAAR
jgi:hypothetical protein